MKDHAAAQGRLGRRSMSMKIAPTARIRTRIRTRSTAAMQRLTRILPKHAPASHPLNLLYLRHCQASPKPRSFIEFVMERFGAAPDRHDQA